MKRFGRPEELAHLCSFLVSDYADFSNGAVVELDAGTWLNRGIYEPFAKSLGGRPSDD